jgi:uncharacterized repeat protein (TIGR01451 family)
VRPRLTLILGLALLGALAVGGAPTAPAAPDSQTHRCKRGFRHAIIAGQHQCLKIGQRCNRRFDRQYHKYGFHCHRGRLTRRRIPPSPPPPPPPPPPSADVSVAKTDTPDPVRVGDNLTYTVTVTNGGPNPADAVQVTDELPAGVTFVSGAATQGTCTGATSVVCTIETIAASASATVTIVVQPTVSGTITNRANATSSTRDPTPANNATTADTVVLPVPPPNPPPPPP